jgi:hypothetical protein
MILDALFGLREAVKRDQECLPQTKNGHNLMTMRKPTLKRTILLTAKQVKIDAETSGRTCADSGQEEVFDDIKVSALVVMAWVRKPAAA